MEAAVLRAFRGSSPLSDLPAEGSITIPTVVDHDPASSVLILEDLGPLATLWDLLTPAACARVPEAEIDDAYGKIGERIGRFFAKVHSKETFTTLSSNPNISKVLSQNLTEKLVSDVAVAPIIDHLRECSIPDAERIHGRVMQAYRTHSVLPRFSLGDFHPGSVLVESWEEKPYVSEETRKLAVIDWEFAKLGGGGVSSDVAQFLAALHGPMIHLEEDSPLYKAYRALATGFTMTYAEDADYNREEGGVSEEDTLTLLRESLILHGREMINLAFERKEEWGSDSMVTITAKGAWYVRKAGEDVEGMREEENWAALRAGDDGFILGLFTLR